MTGEHDRTEGSDALDELERSFGHRFNDRALLERALVHASARAERDCDDNETLEFLGDAVLGLAIAALLMQTHPDVAEGRLSKRRAALVRQKRLAAVATTLGIDRALVLGKGEENSAGRSKPRILASAYEAVLGAVYLDAGHDACVAIVERHFERLLADLDVHGDYKTALQERTQKRHKTAPTYEVLEVSGPAHARQYVVAVVLEGCELARGSGSSRKRAEQEAARLAGQRLEADPTIVG